MKQVFNYWYKRTDKIFIRKTGALTNLDYAGFVGPFTSIKALQADLLPKLRAEKNEAVKALRLEIDFVKRLKQEDFE